MLNISQGDLDLIIILITSISCILIFISMIMVFIYRRKKLYKEDKIASANRKEYEQFLNSFFDAFGGVNNIIKIENDSTNNSLILYIRDNEILNKEKIILLGALSFKENGNKLFVCFDDSTKVYDSLFGK